ncbi:MAG: hypothetical protein EX260_10825 [Desulfobulbaceae bacterium]|nr:MAG: hypothetical protein EX260_10825 [Desulfobulbaceae bacterium]
MMRQPLSSAPGADGLNGTEKRYNPARTGAAKGPKTAVETDSRRQAVIDALQPVGYSVLKKVLQSIGLIAGTIVIMMVIGLSAYVLLWLVLFGFFAYSRQAKGAAVFSDWSWPHFLVTLGFGLGIAYGLLLLTAGF